MLETVDTINYSKIIVILTIFFSQCTLARIRTWNSFIPCGRHTNSTTETYGNIYRNNRYIIM